MMRALKAEFLKLRRSRMLLWTALVVVGYAILASVLNRVLLNDPKFAQNIATAGGVYKKAVEAGFFELNWANQLRVAVQGITGTWGIMLFAFVTTYVFGREYKDKTATNMLTLPVRREAFVAAKMIVVAVWILALTLLCLTLHAVALVLLGVPGFAWSHVWGALWDALTVTFLIYLTLPLVAWITMIGRGYLRGMLFALAAVGVGNGLAGTEASKYYPWNLPVHLAGASWLPLAPADLVPASYLIAIAVFVVGMALAMRHVDATDDAA
jgi:ABC-type transport system involved in multi-copper enzyme maturation permease subunit